MRLQRPGAYKARQQDSGGERFLVFLLHFKGNLVFLLYFTGLSPCKPPALFIPAPVQHPQLLLSRPHLSAPTQPHQCIAQKSLFGLAPLDGMPHYSSLFASAEENYWNNTFPGLLVYALFVNRKKGKVLVDCYFTDVHLTGVFTNSSWKMQIHHPSNLEIFLV